MSEKIKNTLSLWPIAFLVFVCFLFLSIFSRLGASESYNIVLGISLGVLMGFLADLSKRAFDERQKDKILRKTALKLLEQDAKNVYRVFEMYKAIVASKNQPGAPEGVENFLPPNFEMKYWERLSTRDEFLSLAADDSFSKIFKQCWEFEKIDNLLNSVKETKEEKQQKNFYMLALAVSRQIIEDNDHEKFLKLFLGESDFAKYKESLRKVS